MTSLPTNSSNCHQKTGSGVAPDVQAGDPSVCRPGTNDSRLSDGTATPPTPTSLPAVLIQTPGPWVWQSFDGGKTFFLGTPNRGRLVVMDFVRKGMHHAAPRFARRTGPDKGGIMVEATLENVANFPDSHLIAAAPDLLAACKQVEACVRTLMDELGKGPAAKWGIVNKCLCDCKAAVAKAEGRHS